MGSPVSSQAVVGREIPLRVLGELLDGAAAGRPALALVCGEAGIGKTRLVSSVEEAAGAFRVLHGEGVEFGGEELALGPVVAALRDLGEALPEAEGPVQLYERVLDRLGHAAEATPVLLVLEDIHWADRSTLALLAFLARNLRAERIALVATYRVDDELSPELRRLAAELSRRRTVTRIELEPLGRDDVARQLEGIAGAPVPAALADELHARAGGNPFFVEELFAAREATVTEAVRARVARLDGRTLSVLAASGGHATHALLERLGVAPGALRAALDAGVLVPERDGLAFRHGLIGEVIYARLMPAERVALHREIAAALEDAPAAQRAYQCYHAGLRTEALVASIEAGTEAADVYAYDAARSHFERALELWDGSVDRVDLLARTAQAARFAGDPERAVTLCREAITLTDDPTRKALLYERLGEFHFWDDEAALECYDRALELLPGEPRVLAARGHALMGLRRWDESRACCEAALESGAGPRITLGLVLAYLGEPEAGEAHLRRALELAETGEETVRAYLHLGELLRVRGDRAGALATMLAGERAAARLGLRASFGRFMFVNAADDLLRLGRWDEAAERLAEAARIDLSRTAVVMWRATLGLLETLRGDFAAARAALDATADDGLPSEFLAPVAAARAELALTEGDPLAARVHVAGALAGVQDPFYTPPLYSLGLRAEADVAELARSRRQEPETARAGELVAGLDALVTGPDAPPGALAHLALGQAERARFGGVPDASHWHAAAAAFDGLAEPYPAAYARLREAEATLLAGGERPAALTALAAAHDAATRLGARPLADQAAALARRARLGLSAAAPPPSDDDQTGLTTREIEVVRLLADGLTNREIAGRLFISQKTVSAHMAHIYDKLGVHSRVEAAGRAQQLGVLERPS